MRSTSTSTPTLAAVLAAIGLAACATAGHGPVAAQAPPLVSGVDAPAFDRDVRPQDDFFRYVNGTWLRQTPIAADKAYEGSFDAIEEKTKAQLRLLVEQAADASSVAKGSADTRRIGALYRSFMDEAKVEKAGIAPLTEELARIDGIGSTSRLADVMARLGRLGVDLPLGYGIEQDAGDASRDVPVFGQGGLGLPDRDYYLDLDDAQFKALRGSYTAYLQKLLELSGGRAEDAATLAGRIVELETALARAQWSRVENRDPVKLYNRFEPAALTRLMPGFDWPAFLSASGLAERAGIVVVAQPSYATAFAAQLGTTPLPVWKAYLRARLLDSYAPYLPEAYADARFAYVGVALRGTPEKLPRWKRGVALVDASLGEALGKLYVEAHFSAQDKKRMEVLVANLLGAYRESIDHLDWMGPATKKEARAKLATFLPKIGYPKRWIDYDAVDMRPDDLIGNVERARVFRHDRDLAKLGKPVDRDEWQMTPQTVNAYYNPSLNEIVFPASVLQPPFFDAAADDAINYGAIGAIIGHEISHGFDDEGSQFDERGNLRVWWTVADRERFAAKTAALVAQYSAFAPLAGYRINGELTLGENIADNSGLEIAYKAYHRSLAGRMAPVIDGTTGDERFFIGFAQAFRGKARDAAILSQIKSDPHSPDQFRVNGAVRNHPAFYSTFKVEPGDGMYLTPEKRVTIW